MNNRTELLLESFSGTEAISSLFSYQLALLSDDAGIELKSLLGTAAQLQLDVATGARFINGYITRFSLETSDGGRAYYSATLSPWLWMLSQRQDSRIFQERTVEEIVRAGFATYGTQADFEFRLFEPLKTRCYVTQYFESDLDFVLCLLEDEGLFFIFEHTAHRHTLIIMDRSSELTPLPEQPVIRFHSASITEKDDAITQWSAHRQLQSGRMAIQTNDYKQPDNTLAVSMKILNQQCDVKAHEMYLRTRPCAHRSFHGRSSPCAAGVLLVSDEQGSSTATTDNTGALLLARLDRLDQLERFATKESADNNDMTTRLGTLWSFYWQADREFAYDCSKTRQMADEADVDIPRTLPSECWQAKLPRLFAALSNHSSDGFTASPWLPIPWADHQIAGFKAAPVLGYLHRPVKILANPGTGVAGKSLPHIEDLKRGWIEAMNTLAVGERPVRIFYDGMNDVSDVGIFRQALSELNREGYGLDLANPDEGYDIGQRIGFTGVGCALLLINLATVASYQSGGISAVVYGGTDQSLTIQMISPSCGARKTENQRNGAPADPFFETSKHVPGIIQN